ncbi:FAD:protein FMN transferase, partial [uncultured Bilophila sp.]|uniref:FAD:protein FMN transferase n=1 Tax=uncultured Bilophila sp. TaxID=529385 RepID=UPI00262F9BBB
MSTMTRRAFLGMAGVAGAGLWLGLPGTARADVTRETRVMLGTFVDVSLSGTSSMQASEALERAFAEAARLEKVFSRYDGGTPVSELNRAGTLRDCPPELTRLVNRSLFYGAVTGGGFDITVQPVVDLFRARRNNRAAHAHGLDDVASPRRPGRVRAHDAVYGTNSFLHVIGPVVQNDDVTQAVTLDGALHAALQ